MEEYGYFDYAKLFALLEKKKLNKMWLRNQGLHSHTVDKFVKNENVNTDTIIKICSLLNCRPSDIMEFKKY